jgi:ketosteroid isomerase-like protein
MGMVSTRECVEQLIKLAEAGKFLEAIEHCYAPNATMQENSKPPRVGLAALLENERRVLASFKEIRVNRAESFLVDGNRSAINWVYEFIDHEGRSYLRDEIAYQVWQDGKIVQERFFYDPAGPGK